MSRSDYAHHNEEADRIWYEEEGKHSVHVDHYEPEDWDTEPTPSLWDERDDDEDDYETEDKVDENTPDTGAA